MELISLQTNNQKVESMLWNGYFLYRPRLPFNTFTFEIIKDQTASSYYNYWHFCDYDASVFDFSNFQYEEVGSSSKEVSFQGPKTRYETDYLYTRIFQIPFFYFHKNFTTANNFYGSNIYYFKITVPPAEKLNISINYSIQDVNTDKENTIVRPTLFYSKNLLVDNNKEYLTYNNSSCLVKDFYEENSLFNNLKNNNIITEISLPFEKETNHLEHFLLQNNELYTQDYYIYLCCAMKMLQSKSLGCWFNIKQIKFERR